MAEQQLITQYYRVIRNIRNSITNMDINLCYFDKNCYEDLNFNNNSYFKTNQYLVIMMIIY